MDIEKIKQYVYGNMTAVGLTVLLIVGFAFLLPYYMHINYLSYLDFPSITHIILLSAFVGIWIIFSLGGCTVIPAQFFCMTMLDKLPASRRNGFEIRNFFAIPLFWLWGSGMGTSFSLESWRVNFSIGLMIWFVSACVILYGHFLVVMSFSFENTKVLNRPCQRHQTIGRIDKYRVLWNFIKKYQLFINKCRLLWSCRKMQWKQAGQLLWYFMPTFVFSVVPVVVVLIFFRTDLLSNNTLSSFFLVVIFVTLNGWAADCIASYGQRKRPYYRTQMTFVFLGILLLFTAYLTKDLSKSISRILHLGGYEQKSMIFTHKACRQFYELGIIDRSDNDKAADSLCELKNVQVLSSLGSKLYLETARHVSDANIKNQDRIRFFVPKDQYLAENVPPPTDVAKDKDK